MEEIFHFLKRTVQAEHFDCAQASSVPFLSFYGVEKTLDQVKNEVPVFENAEGKKLGTAIGHIATYFLNQGLNATIHTSDVEIFDQTWINLSSKELIEKIQERQTHLKHAVYSADALSAICDGFIQFLKEGGKLVFPAVDEKYVYELLKQGPIYTTINYQFAFQRPRFSEDMQTDPISGNLLTHALLIIGYRDGKFCLLDPESANEEERWLESNRLIGAYYLADLHLDPILITIQS